MRQGCYLSAIWQPGAVVTRSVIMEQGKEEPTIVNPLETQRWKKKIGTSLGKAVMQLINSEI